jgi:hypothetical protein
MCIRPDGKSDSSGGGGEGVGGTAAVKTEKNVVVETGGAGDGFVPAVVTVSGVKVRVVRFEERFIGGGCRRGRREEGWWWGGAARWQTVPEGVEPSREQRRRISVEEEDHGGGRKK